jgi:hypothetical protein
MTDQQPQRAEALQRVRQCLTAERRSDQVQAARHRATAVAVARALSAGVPAGDLATMLRVSRQRVYQIRDEALSPQ